VDSAGGREGSRGEKEKVGKSGRGQEKGRGVIKRSAMVNKGISHERARDSESTKDVYCFHFLVEALPTVEP
jgi:hypothetical protein